MFYIKTSLTEDIEIKVNLYDDEIYTQCPNCGKEIEVQPSTLKTVIEEDGLLTGTTIYCDDCGKDAVKFTRVK